MTQVKIFRIVGTACPLAFNVWGDLWTCNVHSPSHTGRRDGVGWSSELCS